MWQLLNFVLEFLLCSCTSDVLCLFRVSDDISIKIPPLLFLENKTQRSQALIWSSLLSLTSTKIHLSFSLCPLPLSPSPPLAPQHDQIAKLSDERITTPKKRKAPPPPISPLQVNACLPVYLSVCLYQSVRCMSVCEVYSQYAHTAQGVVCCRIHLTFDFSTDFKFLLYMQSCGTAMS